MSLPTLDQITALMDTHCDGEMLKHGFAPVETLSDGMVVHRTYESPDEPFLCDFYVEFGDLNSCGLKIRSPDTPPYTGRRVHRLAASGAMPCFPAGTDVSIQRLVEVFDLELKILAEARIEISTDFAGS